jgi:hypothetical protein
VLVGAPVGLVGGELVVDGLGRSAVGGSPTGSAASCSRNVLSCCHHASGACVSDLSQAAARSSRASSSVRSASPMWLAGCADLRRRPTASSSWLTRWAVGSGGSVLRAEDRAMQGAKRRTVTTTSANQTGIGSSSSSSGFGAAGEQVVGQPATGGGFLASTGAFVAGTVLFGAALLARGAALLMLARRHGRHGRHAIR